MTVGSSDTSRWLQPYEHDADSIQTDRGHEFQALFHWHVADLGMEHVYIKPRTPQLNGKVERSHRTDKEEFYPFTPA